MSKVWLRLVSILVLACIVVSCRSGEYLYDVRVWEDLDANGQQDSDEKPMAGVVIQVINHTEGTLQTRCVTDPQGEAYRAIGPKCGKLDIYVSVPDGYAPTTPVVAHGCQARFGLRPQ